MFPRPLPQQRPAGPALWRSANSPRHQRGDLDGMEFLCCSCFLSSFLRGLVINSAFLQKLCLNDSFSASFDVVLEMVVVNLLTDFCSFLTTQPQKIFTLTFDLSFF